MKNAKAKLAEAVRTLASGEGTIHERLEQAFIYDLATLRPERLPRDLCLVYEGIEFRVKGDPAEPVDAQALRNKVRDLSITECSKVALDLVNLALDLASRSESQLGR